MQYTDYYSETTVSSSTVTTGVTTGAGRNGFRSITSTIQQINPWQGMAAIALVWGAIAGFVNYRRYKDGKISKTDAIAVTASESVGMGVAAGAGLFADAVLKTTVLATIAPTVLPFVMGVTITATVKIAWDCATRKKMIWCEPHIKPLKETKKSLLPMPA